MVISPSLSSPCDCEALPVIAGTEGGGGGDGNGINSNDRKKFLLFLFRALLSSAPDSLIFLMDPDP
jgi:hypothetical protein